MSVDLEKFTEWNNNSTNLLLELLKLSKTFIAHKIQSKYFETLSALHGEQLIEPVDENETPLAKKVNAMDFSSTSVIRIETDYQLPELPEIQSLSDTEKNALKQLAFDWFKSWTESETYRNIIHAITKSKILLHELSNNEGWELTSKSNDSVTYYRPEEGLPTHSFKVVGTAKVDLMSLFSVIYEADLYKQWFPFMNETNELACPERFVKICQAVVGAPWPMYNREFVLEAFGIDNTEEGRVLINIQSLPESGHPALPNGALPPVPSGACRCQMHFSGYMLEILSSELTRISFFANVDPQITILPTSILNFVTGKMIHTIVQEMEKASKDVKNPKSIYFKRREENPKVYNDVQTIVDKVIEALAAQEQKAKSAEEEAKNMEVETKDVEVEEKLSQD